jgi:hypothetical protein
MKTNQLHDELCEAFVSAGAACADDFLPKGYNDEKADVVFMDERVIVEVKSLCKDDVESERVRQSIDRIFGEWEAKGGPIVFGSLNVDVATLPHGMGEEITSVFGERVRKDLKKANRQIRATASVLGWTDFHGVVALATPAHFRTHPGVIGRAAWDLLRRPDQAAQVNGMMTLAVPVEDSSGRAMGQLMMIPHPRGKRPIPEGIYQRMGDGFARHYGMREGLKMHRQDGSEEEFMARFMGPERKDAD